MIMFVTKLNVIIVYDPNGFFFGFFVNNSLVNLQVVAI